MFHKLSWRKCLGAVYSRRFVSTEVDASKNIDVYSKSSAHSYLNEEELYHRLADAVTPLWKVPYEEQLKVKDQSNYEILRELTAWLKPNLSSKRELVCQLKNTIPSPAIMHYRNKNEFHVRYNSEGKTIVGLCIGKGALGTLQCIRPDRLLNTHPIHSQVARHFEDYVNQSKWKICEHFQHGGHWRQLTIRSNSKGEHMIIILIHPQQLMGEDIHNEMLRVKDHLLSSNIKNISSIYYQTCVHTRCTAEQSPYILIHGEPYIYEQILDFEFRISPESFFQVNTEGARVLYDTVGRLLKPNRMSTVLDLCCGTGTQGIMVARHCRGVVGIEASRSAVEDARFNAAHNKIHNAEFYSGRIERLFQPVLQSLQSAPDICAILNPSRGGVEERVIRLLRDNERIRQVVYVSCQADGPAMKNFIALSQPNRKLKNEPFRLNQAIPIDMFPHTNHCELVFSFTR